jgi:hypothetical protein
MGPLIVPTKLKQGKVTAYSNTRERDSTPCGTGRQLISLQKEGWRAIVSGNTNDITKEDGGGCILFS